MTGTMGNRESLPERQTLAVHNKTKQGSDDRAPSFGAVMEARFGRRQAMAGMLAGAGVALLDGRVARAMEETAETVSTLTFPELAHVLDETHHVPVGYRADVLIRWGDGVVDGAPRFDVTRQSAAAQLKQFGYNNDFIGFMPLPFGSAGRDRGLLCVNHEYTNPELMFAGVTKKNRFTAMTRELVDIEMAAHGHSVLEIANEGGRWSVVRPSGYNRRISALATEMRLSGPAAGHDRLKTSADPSGTRVIGTINNCAGGTTPWGTVLIAEENFHHYFGGDPAKTPETRNHADYGIKTELRYAWYRFHPRFDVEKEPNEPNRFGWIVEYDPYDPHSMPVKRTALGRFKHEGAAMVINRDGRAVLYSGDDEVFQYIYRFVSNGRFDARQPRGNGNLLDDGDLSVARFEADGSVRWLPLKHGEAGLTAENGFHSQADVLIETRRAAKILGATPMDRPEDVEANPVTGAVYVMLTKNKKRKPGQIDGANPRAANKHGHVLEMVPPGGRGRRADHAADTFRWDIPILCGDPSSAADGARYHPGVSAAGWLSTPDNCAFDSRGRLWIATDGAPSAGFADGVWATDVEGPGRALTRHFFAAPRGAELCGPCFSPDDRTLFVAVQHPGDEKKSGYATPTTRWPDFDPTLPPRPSVLAIGRRDGRVVGS